MIAKSIWLPVSMALPRRFWLPDRIHALGCRRCRKFLTPFIGWEDAFSRHRNCAPRHLVLRLKRKRR
jgi:hypothetical protein